jgi:hypothetical protein
MLGGLVGGYVKPVLYGLAVLAIAVAAWWLYSAGYDRAEDKWSALYNKREAEIAQAVAAETNRIQQANAMAKAAEARRLAELAAENAALEQRIKELSDEADADPDRDRVCLSDDSRLRVDSIH